MRKSSLYLLASLLTLSTNAVQAAPADDACTAMMEVRGHLVAMLGSTEKAVNDDLKAKIATATGKVDATVSVMMKNASDAAMANAFAPVWEAFKKTRDGEIVPLVYAGKNADAKAIATGIQAERMKQMRGALACK